MYYDLVEIGIPINKRVSRFSTKDLGNNKSFNNIDDMDDLNI